MDWGDGSSAGSGSGRGDEDQGFPGSEGVQRKLSDLEASMKAMKDTVVLENVDKSAKIRRLMEDNILFEETVLLENPSSFQGKTRPMAHPNPFYVFPEEVWEMVIRKMSRPSDLQMVYLAFQQLEPLGKKRNKTIFLFEFNQFWKRVLELVRKFGEHVWNLDIKCRWGSHNEINFYKAVPETLIHLPNLKNLAIDCYFSISSSGPRKANMAAEVVNSPLPPLPHLQSLKLAVDGETCIGSAFAAYFSPQFRRLELRRDTFVNLKDKCLCGLINLEHLEVELESREDILRVLKFPSPNLKNLFLPPYHYSGFRDPFSITSEQIGSLLEKFSQLEHLDLTRCLVEPSASLGTSLRFLRLKTLKIALGIYEDDCYYNLDFLLWFPFLKHLIIKEMYPFKTSRLDLDEMRINLASGQMLDSNIWTLVHSLELLERPNMGMLSDYERYTREMLENRLG